MPCGSRRTAWVSATVVLLALLSINSTPDAEAAAERDRYIVVFEDSIEHPASLARTQVEQRNGKLGFVYRDVLNGYSAELPVQAVEGLRHDPRVKYVAIDGEMAPGAQTTPTGISRTFATANKALDIDSVDDVRVNADIAVIDTGVDYTHPDLNVVARTDCSNGTEKEAKCVDASGTDTTGHGTHVAGIAGAIDNGFGVVGAAPGARIWAVKVLETGTNYTSEMIAGIEWVTAKRKDGNKENDIEVANMSIWCLVSSVCPTKAIDEAITKSVESGVVIVVIAGNANADAKNYTPANSPNAITVSALADSDGQPGGKGASSCKDDIPNVTESLTDDTLASFSNYGATVEIAAPGLCILSTYPGNEYKKMSGTSMAAPYVAGAAAVLAARDEPESKADVEAIRKTLLGAGNTGWTDTSPDGIKEPLLDIGALLPPPTCDYNYASSVRTGRINNNAKEDIYQFSSEGLWGWFSEGSSYTNLGKIGSGFGSAYQDRVGDIDGDGDDDAFQVLDDGRVYGWLSNGEKYTGLENIIGTEISIGGACEIRTLDMNGDGKDDLMRFSSNSGKGYVWLSNGSPSYTYTYIGQKGSEYGLPVEMRSADIDGDGDDDLLRLLDSGKAYGWRSYGTGYTALGTVAEGLGNNYQVQIGDRNNDGKDDIFRFTDSGVGSVWQSDGSWYTPLGEIGTGFGLSRQMKVADMNADGKVDILKFADTGVGYGWEATGSAPITYKYLEKIGSGFGAP